MEGQEENPPALQLEIAYVNQLNTPSTPVRYTPLGGEIMMINNTRTSGGISMRWTPPDSAVRLTAGGRLDVVMQIIYNLGSVGLWRVWLNGVRYEFPGMTISGNVFPAGDEGNTIFATPLDEVTGEPYGGNSKLGLYHHGMREAANVTANATAGHTEMNMYLSHWNQIFRYPTDADYGQMNGYTAVDTSTYL